MALIVVVTVRPNAKSSELVRISAGEYRAAVNAAAQDGKANQALVQLLSDHFDVPKSSIVILRGHRSRKKWIRLGS